MMLILVLSIITSLAVIINMNLRTRLNGGDRFFGRFLFQSFDANVCLEIKIMGSGGPMETPSDDQKSCAATSELVTSVCVQNTSRMRRCNVTGRI